MSQLVGGWCWVGDADLRRAEPDPGPRGGGRSSTREARDRIGAVSGRVFAQNGVERPTVLEATVGFYVPDAHRPIRSTHDPRPTADHARTAIDYTVLVMHSHIRRRFSHNCTIAWRTRAGAAAEAAARFHRIKGAHDAYGIGGGKSGRCCCCLLPLLLEPVDGVLGRGEGARRLLEQLVVHRRQLVTATRAGEHTSAVRALFTAACKKKACVSSMRTWSSYRLRRRQS